MKSWLVLAATIGLLAVGLNSPATAAPTLLSPPPVVKAPVSQGAGEGVWKGVGTRVNGRSVTYTTNFRPDKANSGSVAYAMWIDTSLTKAMFLPGYQVPGGPNPYGGALPAKLKPDLVANFNSAFLLSNSMGGYYFRGTTVKPLVKGRASAVFYKDGRLVIGKWGSGLGMNSSVAAVRQNLNLIVENGRSKVTNPNDSSVWGPTTDKTPKEWRSGVGQRSDGSLVYVIGKDMTAAGLANALVQVGSRQAMVLDMNSYWPAGFYFTHPGSSFKCFKVSPYIAESCMRFVDANKRDSFQFLLK